MGKRGPKPTVPKEYLDKYSGSPTLMIRLRPELWDWVREHGGAAWVRRLLVHLKARGVLSFGDYQAFHAHIQKVVSGAIREVKATHGDVAEHAGSVGKRVAARLWAESSLPDEEVEQQKGA